MADVDGGCVEAEEQEPDRPPPLLLALHRRWPPLTVASAVLPLLLGLAAMVDAGRLLVWDRPLTETAVAHRTPRLNDLALAASRCGSWKVVYPAAIVIALVAAWRSRPLAGVIVVVVAARPAVEWLLKDVVGRPRPAGARLVAGTGFAYPSGHVLAAVATWGFLPAVVALYAHRHAFRIIARAAALALILAVAWSRVWLGVHWTSDVVGSLAIGYLVITLAELWLDRRSPDATNVPPAGADVSSVASS